MLTNLKSQAIAIAIVLARLTAALPSDPSDGTTTTAPGPSLTSTTDPSKATYCRQSRPGPKITATTPGTAVTGLFLSNPSRSGKVSLSLAGYATEISRTSGGIGFFDGCHEWWLNIGTSAYSWKPLSFGFDNEQSFNWVWSSTGLMATETASYPATNWFIACQEAGIWVLYLQTGSDVPDGETCVLTQLDVLGGVGGVTTTATTATTTRPATTTTIATTRTA